MKTENEFCEINVIPFIDIMLVLVIVFMIAAPLATTNIPIDLPTSSKNQESLEEKNIILSIDKEHNVFFGEKQIQPFEIISTLKQIDPKKEKIIFFQADKNISYGSTIEIISTLRDNGYLKIALVGIMKDK